MVRPAPPLQAVAKPVVEARSPGIAKYSATTAASAVATSVGDGEARSLRIAKNRATIAATAVDSTVEESVDEARPPGIAEVQCLDRINIRRVFR